MARSLMKLNDSAWLIAERPRTPMQVGMLATFTVPEGEPDFVARLVERWRGVRTFAPPFNYLFRGLPAPAWQELRDNEIDLDYHFRHSALPQPGSQRELGILVSRLHSSLMDRRYPLWECHVIEGLEEDKWSMYVKVHHSQIDGVGGIRLMRRFLSVDPAARGMQPPWAIGTRGDQSGLPSPANTKRALEKEQRSLISMVTGSAAGIVSSTAAIAGSLGKTYAESATGVASTGRAVPFRAPKSLFNGRIHTPRRFATQQYPIERMKRIAAAGDASLNDVFLAISGGAMRRYLTEQGDLPDSSLTANVPVSVRPGTGPRVGNAITFLYSTLGTDIADPVTRLQAIKQSTQLGKQRVPEVGGVAMDTYTSILMLPFIGQAVLGFGGRGNPASNVVISNVPGPAESRYLDGSRLEQIYPLSLLFNGQALNITAVSYDGQFNIGYTGCRDSVPSLQHIAVYSGEELDALEAALLGKPAKKAAAKKAVTKKAAASKARSRTRTVTKTTARRTAASR